MEHYWIGDIEIGNVQGSGFLVGPNDLLTAAHVVNDSRGRLEAPSSITVFFDGRAIEVGVTQIASPSLTLDDGFIYRDQVSGDFALLTLDTPLGHALGWFGLGTTSTLSGSGTMSIGGYPAETFDGDTLVTGTAEVRYSRSESVTDFQWRDIEPGASGGPLWSGSGQGAVAQGIISSTTWAVEFSPLTLGRIQGWIAENDSGLVSGDVFAVARLYEAGFGRDFDPAGLGFWVGQHRAGASFADMAGAFLDSGEFTDNFGDDDAMSNAVFVETLYGNVLGRAGDEIGTAFWLGEMAGGATRESILVAFADGSENRLGSVDLVGLQEVAPGEWAIA